MYDICGTYLRAGTTACRAHDAFAHFPEITAADPDGILRRNFLRIKCFDCENCELNGKGCDNMVEEEILIKIKDAMKDSRVSQQELLDRLSSL